jgi:hypothetical protein
LVLHHPHPPTANTGATYIAEVYQWYRHANTIIETYHYGSPS